MSEDEGKPGRGRPRTMNADRVLEAALQAYWREDPADVSINRLCQQENVSKPSLYRVFGNEDGLMCAALDAYAERVLADAFTILTSGAGLRDGLDALMAYACDDPRFETGCLFYKMRAGRHRLGPKTRARVEAVEAAAQEAYAAFLQARRDAGDWAGDQPVDASARYLGAQIELAITQRAAGGDPAQIRETLALALSVFQTAPQRGSPDDA